MSAEYYIISGKQRVGPLSSQQILAGIGSGKISFFDLIYNHQLSDWVMIMQHPDFSQLEESQMSSSGTPNKSGDHGDEVTSFSSVGLDPSSEYTMTGSSSPSFGLLPSAELVDDDSSKLIKGSGVPDQNSVPVEEDVIQELRSTTWYLESDLNSPLKYLEVLKLLKGRSLSEHSNISTSLHGPFKPIIEWEDFSKKSIEEFLRQMDASLPQDIMRRRHQRYPCGKIFIFAFGGKGFRALCPDISKSGISFIVQNPKVGVGQSVYVKFSEQLSDNVFDAKAEVVGCRKIRIANTGKVYFRHAMRFTHLSESGRKIVAELTSK